jgi:hypothetical protein
MNSEGETIAKGSCELNEERGEITLRPFLDAGLIDKATSRLFVEMEDGRTFELTSRYMRFRLYTPDGERQSIYRMRYEPQQSEMERSLTR